MTVFDNTALPPWVYIVLITVGSVSVLATAAFLLRWWLLRRKGMRDDLAGLTGPTRRLTVRRGRVVPTSQHLSLTGSKFGMRQFGMLADNESAMTRSKSPFEWWNTIMERSQSRQDRLSMAETGSFMTRPASRTTTLTSRRELGTTTPTMTPEKTKKPTTTTVEIVGGVPSPIPSPLPSPLPSPSPNSSEQQPTVNFSRSFVPRTPSSPIFPRNLAALSRIEESSPHHSMISVGPSRSKRTSYYEPLNSTAIGVRPRELEVSGEGANGTSRTSIVTQQRSATRVPRVSSMSDASRELHRKSAGEIHSTSPANPASHRNSMTRPKTADGSAASHRRKTSATKVPVPVPHLAVPKPVAPRGSRTNLGADSSQVRFSRRVSTASRSDTHSVHSISRKSSASIGLSGVMYESQLPEYWQSRTDLHDVLRQSDGAFDASGGRTIAASGQGHKTLAKQRDNVTLGRSNSKVLRKKSMKRAELVSSVCN